MLVPNRHGSSESYRYGFNGKENDNEVIGEGNSQDYGMRMYNPRIGRFFNVDPLTKSYPELTPYQFASNTPIQAIDLDGLEGYKVIDHKSKTTTIVVDLYYSPKNFPNKTKEQKIDAEFTEKQINKIVSGIMKEFNRRKMVDYDNVDVENENINAFYTVKLQINKHAKASSGKALSESQSTKSDPFNSRIMLYKQQKNVIKEATSTFDSEGNQIIKVSSVVGGSVYGKLGLINLDSHTAIHELFHNLIHNHQNASKANQELIKQDKQIEGHSKAGGIFIYANSILGIKTENLNQKNVSDALNTLPVKNPETP